MEVPVLEECGLTSGEGKTYLALISLGTCTAGPIAKRTGMQRSTVYFCLGSLISKGLASHVTKNRRKHFRAENPEKLFRLIDSKMGQLEKSKEAVARLVQQAEGERKERAEEATVFQGWGGMKAAFDDILRTLKKEDDMYVFGVLTSDSVFPRFRRFLGKFNQGRMEIGFRFNVIMNRKLMDTLGKDREAEPGAFVKYLPEGMETPAVSYIYGDKVIIAIWKSEPVCFVIESPSVAQSFRKYFEVLWAISKTRKEMKKT